MRASSQIHDRPRTPTMRLRGAAAARLAAIR